MRAIWKYQIFAEDSTTLLMPVGAKVLDVQVQHGEPHLWAVVDPKESALEHRIFRLIGTGHLFEDYEALRYIGTFQTCEGRFVGHLFEYVTEKALLTGSS
jgi:hypothetical protein